MRVLALTPTFYPIVGGAELLIDDVLRTLSREHEVSLLTPFLPQRSRAFWVPEGDGHLQTPYPIERFADSVNLARLRGNRYHKGVVPPMSMSVLPVLERRVRALRPDVLLTFFSVPFGLPSVLTKMRHGLRLVMVLCGTDLPSPRTEPVPFWHSYTRAVTARADRTVYVSRFCFDALEKKRFDPAHDRVIHGGVHAEQLRPTMGPGQLRAQLGISDEEIMLFALQRLGPEKRVDVLLQATARLLADGRRVRLVVGGQGPEAPALADLSASLGIEDRVLFVGHLGEEKADYFAACDMFVFHSLFETFGQVLAEAMTAGVPVVSVRAGAIPEVVRHGETGILVQPNDDASFAAAVGELIDAPVRRGTLALAGRTRAERDFDWDSISKQWCDAVTFPEALGEAGATSSTARTGGPEAWEWENAR